MKMTIEKYNQLDDKKKEQVLKKFKSDQLDFILSLLGRMDKIQTSHLDTLDKHTRTIRALTAIEFLTREEVGIDLKGKVETIHRFAKAALLLEDDENYDEWKEQIDTICDRMESFGKNM